MKFLSAAAGRRLVIGVPTLWLLLFFLLPFLIVLKLSFSSSMVATPPYMPLFEIVEAQVVAIRLNLGNYLFLLTDDLYVVAYLNSVVTAAVACVACLLIGYPMAYAMARARPLPRTIMLMLVILPFWSSFLIRVYAWIGLLQTTGPINGLLVWLGLTDAPLALLNTPFAVYVGIVYNYLPFMVLPLYANLEKLDPTLLEAAADLGARPFSGFLQVTLPLSLPGIIAGSLLVFIPVVGEFVIPELLGGPDTLMIGSVLWNEFFNNRDWPIASAVAVAMVLLLVLPIMGFQASRGQAASAHGSH